MPITKLQSKGRLYTKQKDSPGGTMENLCKKLMLGGSMAAMVAAISATAQAQDSQQTEAVEVSASRINIQGYTAPTLVTVIGAEQLNRDAKVDIGDAIRELSAVGQSDSPSNGSHSHRNWQTRSEPRAKDRSRRRCPFTSDRHRISHPRAAQFAQGRHNHQANVSDASLRR
jgi:hypothetical protein